MKAAEDNAATLREHMRRTYLNVRYGIGIIGAALPLLPWIGARRLLASMSADRKPVNDAVAVNRSLIS